MIPIALFRRLQTVTPAAFEAICPGGFERVDNSEVIVTKSVLEIVGIQGAAADRVGGSNYRAVPVGD